MALTTAELKKMEKIEQLIAEKKKEVKILKEKGAHDFAIYAMKYELWKLDKVTAEKELKAISERHKTV